MHQATGCCIVGLGGLEAAGKLGLRGQNSAGVSAWGYNTVTLAFALSALSRSATALASSNEATCFANEYPLAFHMLVVGVMRVTA